MIECILSIPPSANQIWRATVTTSDSRVITYKTREAKQWQEEAAWELRLAAKGQGTPFGGAVVRTAIYWPDSRRRDAQNVEKLEFDAIQDSGIVTDDKNILSHTTEVRGVDEKRPRLEIEILDYWSGKKEKND